MFWASAIACAFKIHIVIRVDDGPGTDDDVGLGLGQDGRDRQVELEQGALIGLKRQLRLGVDRIGDRGERFGRMVVQVHSRKIAVESDEEIGTVIAVQGPRAPPDVVSSPGGRKACGVTPLNGVVRAAVVQVELGRNAGIAHEQVRWPSPLTSATASEVVGSLAVMFWGVTLPKGLLHAVVQEELRGFAIMADDQIGLAVAIHVAHRHGRRRQVGHPDVERSAAERDWCAARCSGTLASARR